MDKHGHIFLSTELLVTPRHDLLKVSLPSRSLLSPPSLSGPLPACDRVWGLLRKAGPRAQVVIPHHSHGSAPSRPPYQTLTPPSSPPSISISLPHVPVKVDYRTLGRFPTVKTRHPVKSFSMLSKHKGSRGASGKCSDA